MSIARQTFEFIHPGELIDRELELVLPEPRWIDDMLLSCHHAETRRNMPLQARTTREQLLAFVQANPYGFTRGDPWGASVPSYTFWMRLRPAFYAAESPAHPQTASASPTRAEVPMAGAIGLRLGFTRNLEMYLGHIGYHVLPPARGHHYAERACRLILSLARAYGFRTLWITTNPDNIASRRTCERLGASLINIVPVPRENPLYLQGDREKCRYRLDL